MTHPNLRADSEALFKGKKTAHMGVHQYNDHAGMRDGKSMSGARLWAEADAARLDEHRQGLPNKAGAEIELLKEVGHSIQQYIPVLTEVIELGPGTLRSFRTKTLPILKALDVRDCLIVDSSATFLKDIRTSQQDQSLVITPIEDDFFLASTIYQKSSTPSLLCSFGGIISNLIAPMSFDPPIRQLTETLQAFANKIREGWILLAFDSLVDADETVSYYTKHTLFQLNVFDRMEVELPFEGDFDAQAFDYAPQWESNSYQLGHFAVLRRPLTFKLGPQSFSLPKGHRLHLKNSFKFPPEFFEACCHRAGLLVVKHWSKFHSHCYLLKK